MTKIKAKAAFAKPRAERLAGIFAALADPTRCQLFRSIANHRGKPLASGDLAAHLRISAPLASQSLKILQQAGLLQRRKQGQRALYLLPERDALVRGLQRMIQ